jgi:hypothetical protein
MDVAEPLDGEAMSDRVPLVVVRLDPLVPAHLAGRLGEGARLDRTTDRTPCALLLEAEALGADGTWAHQWVIPSESPSSRGSWVMATDVVPGAP